MRNVSWWGVPSLVGRFLSIQRRKPEQVRDSNDRWLAYAGVALGIALAVILILIRLYQPLGLAITIEATSLGYLAFKDRLRAPSLAKRGTGSAGLMSRCSISMAGFFAITIAIAGLLAIAASADALRRPVWVFLVLAGIPGLILAQRMFLPKTGDITTLLLVQAIMLAVAMVLTSVAVFPHNGGDTWAHLHNAEVILEHQRVQAIEGAYRDYPLYPALLSILSVSTGWDAAQAARFLNVFIAVVCLLLMYALSRQFHAALESLVLLLILLGGKWFIHWATLVVSMNTAMLFFCLLMVILFRRLYKKADTKEMIVLMIIAGMIPFFHPVGSVAAIFLLVGFWALEGSRQHSLIGLAGFVTIFTLTQWMYFGDFIFDRTVQDLGRAIFHSDSSIQLASSNRDAIVYTLDHINFYALLGLAGLEVMRQLFSKTDRLNLHAGLLGLGFVVFGYVTQAVSLLGAVPYRWLLFGTLLLVFPASSAFTSLFVRKSVWVRILAVDMIILYFFTGLTNTEVNRDHPLYGEEVTQLLELTSSEYAGLRTLQEAMQERDVAIRVDLRLWDYLKYVPDNERCGCWQQIRLDGFNGIFAFRPAYSRRSFLMDSAASQFDREQTNLSQFYDSGDMQLLDHADEAALEK